VYRLLRTPGGIAVLAEEDGCAVVDGSRVALVGAHDADVGTMFAQLREMVRFAIHREYLKQATHREGWIMHHARHALAKRIPEMADSPMRGGWAGAIAMTEDGKPIIDRHPAIQGCFVFTGDSGSSFKTAPAIGRIFAEWIADGYPSVLDPRPFRIQRFVENEPVVAEYEYCDRDTEYSRVQKIMLG
jgi:glycine/D-amino acid oxidase-like deaminating enzyme